MFAVVGWSALVAAIATVVGATFLFLFFSRGQPWGTLNDLASIVMMLATIPVALAIPDIEDDAPLGATHVVAQVGLAWAVGGIGIVGMAVASVAQGLLVLRLRAYEALLPWTLGAGAVVGVWYGLVGLLGLAGGYPRGGFSTLLALLAIASGLGYVGIGYAFWRWGSQPRRLSIASGILALVASTGFLAWIGVALTSDVGLLSAAGPGA